MTGYNVQIDRLEDVALINLRCEDEVAARLTAATSIALDHEAFRAKQSTDRTTARLAPDQWWVRTTLADELNTFKLLKDAAADDFAAVTIISDHFQGFSISGADTDAVLSQATSINLSTLTAGTVTRGKFARSGGTLFVVEPAQHVEVFVESSYAAYIEAYLAALAGRPRAITP